MKKCNGCQKEYEPRHAKDHRCADCYSKQGKRISRRGRANEHDFATKLMTLLNSRFGKELYKVRRTPMSGALHLDVPADIWFPKSPLYSVFRTLHIDTKIADTFHPERWYDEEKNLCRSSGSLNKVVIVMRHPRDQKQLALISWDDLEKLLVEIEGYRREENNE